MQKLKYFLKESTHCHKDANGNAMIFVVLVLFTLVCFFVFTIHIGQRFTNKVEMQNAADAAAVSGAVWKARGFNLISILNVSMSECLALIIMFKAFNDTVRWTRGTIALNITVAGICCGVPYTSSVCCPWLRCLNWNYKYFNKAHVNVNKAMKKTYQSPKILWKLMKGLKKASEGVAIATSILSYLDASRIAKRNGADPIFNISENIGYHAILWPYQLKLPVKDGTFEKDLCDHTWNGGEGYNNYLCWKSAMDIEIFDIEVDRVLQIMWASLLCVMPNPLIYYEMFKRAQYNDLCSTSGSSPLGEIEMPNSTMDCDKCESERGNATWEGFRIELTRNACHDQYKKSDTGEENLGSMTFENGRKPQGAVELNNGCDIEDCPDTPSPCRVCNNLQTIAPEQEGQPPRFFADIWVMKSCEYEGDDEDEEPFEIETEDHDNDKVQPLVLDDDWQDKVKYTSLVLKDENEVGGSLFLGADGEPIISLRSDMSGEMITYGESGDSRIRENNGRVGIPERTWAVARAVVYNPGQEDLFNQNWHAKLAPMDVEGITTEFMGQEIELPESLTNLVNDVVEEVWAH